MRKEQPDGLEPIGEPVGEAGAQVVEPLASERRDLERVGEPVREPAAPERVDAVDALRRRRLSNMFPEAVQVSALTGEGLDALRGRIAERFADRYEAVRLFLPYEEGAKLAELYALGAPIDERIDAAEGVLVRARLPRRELRRFAPYLVAESRAEPASTSA